VLKRKDGGTDPCGTPFLRRHHVLVDNFFFDIFLRFFSKEVLGAWVSEGGGKGPPGF